MSANRQSNSHDERPRSHDARRPASLQSQAGVAARQLAVDALIRIDADGAYANLAVPALLQRSDLETRDRGFVTELVYGTTRMQRACDWLVDRFLPDPERIDVTARAWLRLGAFQLAFLDTPPHAAVGATVEAAPRKISGLCNAVLRKVATSLPVEWPSDVVRLSQPDWIFERLVADLGHDDALGAMDAMNRSATSTTRDDGYVQDLASQWVAEAVGAGPGDLVLDMCAAPGGKATAISSSGARVVASDMRETRSGLVAENAARLGLPGDRFAVVTADGTSSPFRPGTFDRVLLDAPCSGLGALRRRPDARWRINPEDIGTLCALQKELLVSALDLVKPGGEVTFSVCTLTRAESVEIDEWLAETRPEVVALASPGAPWIPAGRGALLLPQAEGTDGMYILRLRRPESSTGANS